MDKFGLVKMNCGIDAWRNNCTEDGRIELQNTLKGKSISENTIIKVFSSVPFMSIGGDNARAKKPVHVEIKRFFPEDGVAEVGCYYHYDSEHKWGTSVQLYWTPKQSSGDYAELKKQYDELANRVAILEKLIASK